MKNINKLWKMIEKLLKLKRVTYADMYDLLWYYQHSYIKGYAWSYGEIASFADFVEVLKGKMNKNDLKAINELIKNEGVL